jgi:hypothetical protein
MKSTIILIALFALATFTNSSWAIAHQMTEDASKLVSNGVKATL